MTYSPKGVHSPWASSAALVFPTISSLSGTPREEDLGAFTLTVTGTGFTPDSVVQWAGADRATTYVSATSLTASILSGDVDDVGTFAVTVTKPGVGASSSSNFSVTAAPPGTPTILSTTNTASESGTSHAITMPGTIDAGDLLVCLFCYRDSTLTSFTGWTQLMAPVSTTFCSRLRITS